MPNEDPWLRERPLPPANPGGDGFQRGSDPDSELGRLPSEGLSQELSVPRDLSYVDPRSFSQQKCVVIPPKAPVGTPAKRDPPVWGATSHL